MLENIQENYNLRGNPNEMTYDNDRYKYDISPENLYGQNRDYQANYGEYPAPITYLSKSNLNYANNGSGSNVVGGGGGIDNEYPNTQIINQMMTNHHTNPYLYDKQRAPYMGSKNELSYMSKERLTPNLYNTTPRDTHYGLKSPAMYSGAGSVHSVHSMLKNDYQVIIIICTIFRFYFQNTMVW